MYICRVMMHISIICSVTCWDLRETRLGRVVGFVDVLDPRPPCTSPESSENLLVYS